jgi:hypothetical protein
MVLKRLDQQLGLVVSASAEAPKGALIRVSTLFDLLVRRQRSGAESHETHLRQAAAEAALQALAESLGSLDDHPLRMAIEERQVLQ